MKAAIIGIQNIKHMTLISLYTNYFKKRGIEYDVIYIDKYGIDEITGAKNDYKLNASGRFYSSLVGKCVKSVRFIFYAEHLMKNNKYDFVVIWREQTAAMFSRFLGRRFNGKYCVNIRDLWNDKKLYITKGVKRAVKNSLFNTVSSEGFLDEIPKAEYMIIHSVNENLIKKRQKSVKWDEGTPIVITYIGTVRFYDYCFSLVNALANDNRFLLKFIGQGSEIIADYVDKHHIKNVSCIGSFNPEDTMNLLVGTHIINCAFGATEIAEKKLMPIRYYYALYLNCPVLTTEGTWVAEEARKHGIGISIPNKLSSEDIIVDNLYEECKKHINIINHDLDAYRDEIQSSNRALEEKLDAFFFKNGES